MGSGVVFPPHDYARQDLNTELIPLNLCDQEVPNCYLPDIYALRSVAVCRVLGYHIPMPARSSSLRYSPGCRRSLHLFCAFPFHL